MEDLMQREVRRMFSKFGAAADAINRAQEGFQADEFCRMGRIDYVVSQLGKCREACDSIKNAMDMRYRRVRDELAYHQSLLDVQQQDFPE